MAKKKTAKKTAKKDDCELTAACCDEVAAKCHKVKKATECPTMFSLAKKLQLAAQAMANHMRSCEIDDEAE